MRLAPLASAAVTAAALLALSAPALAGGPELLIGASEDAVKAGTMAEAQTNTRILKLAGFDSVRMTSVWWPGETQPDEEEVIGLRNAIGAAQLNGVRVYLSVYHHGNRTTPLTEEARAEFVAYTTWLARTFPYVRDFVVGNEPNLNRFWMPQFGQNGENVAAPAYLTLLAEAYDALKAVNRRITVVGGALAPRGIDRPGSSRDTHSPAKFIRDLGLAYRASGRTLPIMDQFSIHPYGTSSSQPPAKTVYAGGNIGLGNYAKLVRTLTQAFAGTAQPGATLPIVYQEFGIETRIPANKRRFYTGSEPAATKPVTEKTQAQFYREAVQMAFCQKNVRALMLFHVFDEPALGGWQSGVYYADKRPKASLPAVRKALGESRRGVVAKCKGLALTPRVLKLAWPRGPLTGTRPATLGVTCSIDCTFTAELVTARGGKVVASAAGVAVGRKARAIRVTPRKAKPGRYLLRLRLVAAVNAGPVVVRTSPPLALR